MRGKGVQLAPAQPTAADTALMQILAVELRVPLLEARQALDIARSSQGDSELLVTAASSLQQGMQLLEQYISSGQILRSDQELAYQSVTIGALLEDVAHTVMPLARLHDVELAIDYRHIKRPILADASKIAVLLENLVTAFLRVPSRRVVLGAHATAAGIRAGVFSDQLTTGLLLKHVHKLAGGAPQPGKHAAGGSAHLLIADWIGQKTELPIGPATHSHLNGLAVTLPWSSQLRLV